MFRFKGFKASLNFSSGKRVTSEYFEDIPSFSMTGAYRSSREDVHGYSTITETYKSIPPSMVKLPTSSRPLQPIGTQTGKGVSNVTQPSNILVPLNSRSENDVSSDPNGNVSSNVRKTPVQPDPKAGTSNKKQPTKAKKVDKKESKTEEKEQKRQEKKNLAEQKKRDKIAAQERAKEEKLRKQREKEAEKLAREERKKDKTKTEIPGPRTNPLAQGVSQYPTNTAAPSQYIRNPQKNTHYSSNTLESSISKSSGPPPYSEDVNRQVVENQSDNTGNTSFGKPIDTSSTWDMISQHRQQISRPVVAKTQKETIDITGRKSIYV